MALANINYPVTDLAAAKAVFTALFGVEPHTDTEYYVGYNVDGLEIALNPGGAHSRACRGPRRSGPPPTSKARSPRLQPPVPW